MEQSKSYEMNIVDCKKWIINIIKYVVAPILLYILTQYQGGKEIDISIILNLAIGPVIDFLHRFSNDNTKPL